MKNDVFTVPFTYPSSDGKSQIAAQVWSRVDYGEDFAGVISEPKGVIQFIHGMTEHIERYDTLARYFVEKGFVACAEDHIGHGHTATSKDNLGSMPAFGGKSILLNDVESLRRQMQHVFPHIPYVMYGHSMGSLILRDYLTVYGEGLSAAVISATHNGSVLISRVGKALAQSMALTKGDDYMSQFFHKQGAGNFSEAIPDAKTPLDWLTHDDQIIQQFMQDEYSNFPFGVGAYATLLDITADVASPKSAAKCPKDIPLLFVAGNEDPVGDYGKAVEEAAEMYRKAGVKTVDVKIYSGMRHEPQNEIDRKKVFHDIEIWLDHQLAQI